MKTDKLGGAIRRDFLSDLCGREASDGVIIGWHFFLSDLCGREADADTTASDVRFLSDLCGREEHWQ